MRPETIQAWEQAQDQPNRMVREAAVLCYIADGWDSYWPYPGPVWLKNRYVIEEQDKA